MVNILVHCALENRHQDLSLHGPLIEILESQLYCSRTKYRLSRISTVTTAAGSGSRGLEGRRKEEVEKEEEEEEGGEDAEEEEEEEEEEAAAGEAEAERTKRALSR